MGNQHSILVDYRHDLRPQAHEVVASVECVEIAVDGFAGEDGKPVVCAAADQSVDHLVVDYRVERDYRAKESKMSSMGWLAEVEDRRAVHDLADMAKAVDYQDA